MEINEHELAVKATAYADEELFVRNVRMATASYNRSTKMTSPCFTGADLEKAYEFGYRQAWEDKHEVPPEKEYYGG